MATTPNPGHPWTGVGDGVFAITGPSVLRTFTFPNADATVLTSLTTDFDVASAGALTFGNSVATSVSICNSAACDTLSLATNTDADTISIGDSLDTLNLAGTTIAHTLTTTSSSTFASSTSNTDILAIKPQTTTTTATFTGTITSADLTAARTWTLPDNTGTLALTSDITNSSGWTDGGTDVTLTTSTDNIGVGGASLAKLSVDGDTDEIQLLVQGNATQTPSLAVFENSAGTDQFVISNTGNITATGDLAVNGGDITSSGTLTIDTGSSLSLCNSAACDTVTLATNTDADTVTIGDSTDSLSLASANWSITSGGVLATVGSITQDIASGNSYISVHRGSDTSGEVGFLVGGSGFSNAWAIYRAGSGDTGDLKFWNDSTSDTLVLDKTGGGATFNYAATVAGVLTAQTATSGFVLGTGAAATTLSSTASSARAISLPNASGTIALTSDISSSGTITTVTTRPAMATGGTADVTENSLTTYRVGLFHVPGNITVNQLSYNVGTVTTAGSYRICVYSADGATKHIDVTDVPAVGVNSVSVSSVVLAPGYYYVAFGCATTCNNQITHYVSTSTPMFSTSTPSGKLMYEADTTMTSGTCNTTLPTLTGQFNRVPVIRLDN